jgi:uncharacterized alpha-E superfamily protein
MLGKTAGGLFWMYRYLERAENTARLIETGQRIALTRLAAVRRRMALGPADRRGRQGYDAKP